MPILRKINNNRAPAGLEWKILRKLPHVLAGGTLIPLFIAFASRQFPPEGTAIEIERHIHVASKASWEVIPDSVVQYPEGGPEDG